MNNTHIGEHQREAFPDTTVQQSHLCSGLCTWLQGTVAQVLLLYKEGVSLQPTVSGHTPSPVKDSLVRPSLHPDQGW